MSALGAPGMCSVLEAGQPFLAGTAVLTAKMTDCVHWCQLTSDGSHNAYFCNECQLPHSGTGGGGTLCKRTRRHR